MAWRIGVDAGTCFTGLCLFEDGTGRVEVWKVPATPDDTSRGVDPAIAAAMARFAPADPGAAEARPVRTARSGVCSGALAAQHLAAAAGLERLICVDIGGIATEAALPDGTAVRIGAGGLSAASVRSDGTLRLDPQDGGGDARHGRAPTVTDAHIALATIGPHALLGGCVAVRPEAAAAVLGALAGRLGTDVPSAARQVVASLVTAIATAISGERGVDATACTLVVFGGAGPLHAAALARALGIARVLVPRHPGLLGAIGALLARRHAAFTAPGPVTLSHEALPSVAEIFGLLRHRAATWFADEQIPADTRHIGRSVRLRRSGHSFEVWVDVPDGPISAVTIGTLADRLAEAVGCAPPDAAPLELLALRVEATGRLPGPCFRPLAGIGPDASAARTGSREAWLPGPGPPAVCEVYDRARLNAGNVIKGPALIEEADATTLLPRGMTARVDGMLGLMLEACA